MTYSKTMHIEVVAYVEYAALETCVFFRFV